MSARFFGYCERKGCTVRKPFLAVTLDDGTPVARTPDRMLISLYNAAYFRTAASDALMERRGLWCDSHGPMRVAPLNATYNPDKKCDGRCANAKRATCDCSCNGANHGAAYC
ncbi:hypothetical protein OG896_24400 [Streptomyces sp. NBC_00669]|uniref:hypothetical protein n=1 Tax=Streptomyces sp. NBC_00669 TaxID=2976011 RepID=UPI002E346154|nr:hypothetical protein [Streptomyces sp. NBC_00669]